MSVYYTYCPHETDPSKKKKIFLGNHEPKLNTRGYCHECDHSCKFIGIEKDGDQYYVVAEPVFESRSIDPYLNPHLFDDENLDEKDV